MALTPVDRNLGKAELRALLSERLRLRGPLTFAEFMEVVLYTPGLGYYSAGSSGIGPDKDFFTSVSATPVFGRVLAGILQDLRARLGEGVPFTVHEFGSHGGRLAGDLREAAPELEVVEHEVGDPLPAAISGCVLSNELLDALPFHRLEVVGGVWRELYVAADPVSGGLHWQVGPLSEPLLAERVSDLPVKWMEGYQTEICLAGERWLTAIAERLERGFVLSFDYGFERFEYFSPRRSRGGLRCFRGHQLHDDPFVHLGEQDITADVDFDALIAAGQQCGLETVTFSEQGRFLWKMGQRTLTAIVEREAGQLSRERNGIHLLTHPSLMGDWFKALLQRKL